METVKKLIFKIDIKNDVLNNFDHGIVQVTPELAARIRHLSRAAIDLDVHHIAEFNSSVRTMISDYDAETSSDGKQPLLQPENGSVDCCFLKVEKDCFSWSGLIKNTDVRWSMDIIPLCVLDESGDYDERDDF